MTDFSEVRGIPRDSSWEEGRMLHAGALELENAICALLDSGGDKEKQQLANQWLNHFVATPLAWTVSLYTAFPPINSHLGKLQEVRFFALNLLLSKIRNDWVQLSREDAQEIYETLTQQLPLIGDNNYLSSRLSIVIAATAGVAGETATYELIESIVGSDDATPTVEGSLAFDLLLALADEVLSRSRSLPPEVGGCLQDCCSMVIQHLETVLRMPQSAETQYKVLTCLERWIPAGITLSELYSENTFLFQYLVDALGASNISCFDAAVSTLVELVSAVDILPGRKEAVHGIIAALLEQQGAYLSNDSSLDSPSRKRALGLCNLLGAICMVEAPLVAKGEFRVNELLNWLVDSSGGGGGLGIEGAMLVVEAWPRLVAVPAGRRAGILQRPLFANAARAVMHVAMYPADFKSWQESEVDEDNFYRFRESFAEDALGALFQETGTPFLDFIREKLQFGGSWQSAEVCFFAASSLRNQLLFDTDPEKAVAANSFLQVVMCQLPESTAVIGKVKEMWPNGSLVKAALVMLERYAERAALDPNILGMAVQYSVGALYITDARAQACTSLRELCRAAAPSIAAAQALAPLMAECEKAVASVGLELGERLAIVQGLAAVAAALPVDEAGAAFSRLTATAAYTLRILSTTQERTATIGTRLSSEIRVFTSVLDCGASDVALQAMLPILRDAWPVLDFLATSWAADAEVARSLCELWGMLARKVGILLAGCIPTIVERVTAMFQQHMSPVCLQCLSEVVVLSSDGSTVDNAAIEHSLTSVLLELSTAILGFERTLEAAERNKPSKDSSPLALELGEKENNASEVLGAVCLLGKRFLHGQPALFLCSPAFIRCFGCALGCMRRKELGPALAAARFLADVILCSSFKEDEMKDIIVWRLPDDLVPQVDQAMSSYGTAVVEVVLTALADSPKTPLLREALALVLYALCSRYRDATHAALTATIMSPTFPVRPGLLSEDDKHVFVATVVRHPVHPRRRFQELISEFCGVCQALIPAEVLSAYVDGM